MIRKLLTLATAFCIATILTQVTIGGYLLINGRLGGDTMTKMLALANGIDISGERLQFIMKQNEDRELPDFNDVLRARTMAAYDMELLLSAQQRLRTEMSESLVRLQEDQERFDDRVETFQNELEQIRQGVEDEGLEKLKRTLNDLEPAAAKEQLLMMFDDGKKREVVIIIDGMQSEKRRDILAEFTGADDPAKLAEILKLIEEGGAAGSLVEGATPES
ncbi:MAG: hypothetical protein AAF664_13115 [Planctomycetota bacterium]